MNSLCYRCHVAGCTYTYLSDACAAARCEDRDTGAKKQPRESDYSGGAVRTHREYL